MKTEKVSQIVGDSFPFSERGTLIAKQKTTEFIDANKENIFLYGATGRSGVCADANGTINLILDERPDLRNQFVGNIVDEHTVIATKPKPEGWGCTISSHLQNFILVYSATPQATVKFGDDPISDILTNAISLCLEGGVQTLKQITDLLNKHVPVVVVTKLRELAENCDPITKYPYLSAADFLMTIKKSIRSTLSTENAEKLVQTYFLDHALFNNKKGANSDAGTKQNLYDQFIKQFMENRVWEKLNFLTTEIKSLTVSVLNFSVFDPSDYAGYLTVLICKAKIIINVMRLK